MTASDAAGASGGLAGLGQRLRMAGQAALDSAGGAGDADGLLARLEQIGRCLEEAELRLRRGERDTEGALRAALEDWRGQARQVAVLVAGALELAAGHAASAGVISGYGPAGARPAQTTGCRLDESG